MARIILNAAFRGCFFIVNNLFTKKQKKVHLLPVGVWYNIDTTKGERPEERKEKENENIKKNGNVYGKRVFAL